jgi:hypothetical protein
MEIQRDDVNWINLAQDTDQWRDLMNIIMKLPVPISWLYKPVLATQEILCSKELNRPLGRSSRTRKHTIKMDRR